MTPDAIADLRSRQIIADAVSAAGWGAEQSAQLAALLTLAYVLGHADGAIETTRGLIGKIGTKERT